MLSSSSEDYEELVVVDRRAHPRIPVVIRVVDLDADVLYYQHATTLSEGGLFLEGMVAQPVGKRLTLLFVPPGTGVQVVIRAEVVGRLEEPVTGSCVMFLEDDSSPTRAWLRRWIHDQLS